MPNKQKQFGRLFAPADDTKFESFDKLLIHCNEKQRKSEVHGRLPADLLPIAYRDQVQLKVSASQAYGLNDWSFGQVCELAKVKKETVNRINPETAAQALQ